MGDSDVKSAEEIERTVKRISFQASCAMDEQLWTDIARAGNCRPAVLTPERKDIRRFVMRMSTKRIAVAAVVLIGLGAITAVGVNIGRIYYWGTSEDGTRHFFGSEGGEGALGDGFITMDASHVTNVEQTAKDLEEMKNLSQQGKKELLRVEETSINGTVDMIMHEYRYTLSDGRTEDMREGMKWGGGFDNKQRWQEWRQLRDAGPGQDLGTSEETVEGRVVSFKRERYVLGDGTEIIWSVGTPKDGQ
jgi:hypothetical protein